MTAMDGQFLEQMRQFLSHAEHSISNPTAFCLIVIPDTGRAVVERFEDIHGLLARMRTLYGQPGIQTIPVEGLPIPLTRPPNRCLRYAGTDYPLKEEEPADDLDDNFFLCDTPALAAEELSVDDDDADAEDDEFDGEEDTEFAEGPPP